MVTNFMYISNSHKMKTDTSKKVFSLHYPTCAFSKNKWIKKNPKSFFFPLSDTRLFQLAGANVEGRPRCFFWLRGKRGKIAAHRTSGYLFDTWKNHQSINITTHTKRRIKGSLEEETFEPWISEFWGLSFLNFRPIFEKWLCWVWSFNSKDG